MTRSATLLFLPAFFFAACETTETTKPRHLSSTRALKAESGGPGNKALVRKSDPRTLTKYKKVVVENVRVAQPGRAPDGANRRATRQEAQQLANRFEEILRDELRPHYQITNRRGRDTLVVRATLTDLQPSRPGVFVFNYLPYAAAVTTGLSLATGKTPGAGSTTVEAEVLDASSRRQVYALVDQYKGSKFQPSGVSRWGQTESAMRTWSRQIRSGIQGAKSNRGAVPAGAKRSTHKVNEKGKVGVPLNSKRKR